MRRGNMGHLTRIANAVVRNLEGGPAQTPVSEVIRGEPCLGRTVARLPGRGLHRCGPGPRGPSWGASVQHLGAGEHVAGFQKFDVSAAVHSSPSPARTPCSAHSPAPFEFTWPWGPSEHEYGEPGRHALLPKSRRGAEPCMFPAEASPPLAGLYLCPQPATPCLGAAIHDPFWPSHPGHRLQLPVTNFMS